MTSETALRSAVHVPKWKLFDALVVGAALLFLMLLGLFVQFTASRPLPSNVSEFQWSLLILLTVSAAQLAITGLFIISVGRERGLGGPLSSIDWNASRNMAPFALVGVALAAVIALTIGVGQFTDGLTPLSISLYLLGAVVLQPFVEECYFRGILFVAVADKIGDIGSVVSTALLFAWLHPMHRITILPIAILLGVTRARTRSVAACFVLHAAYNVGVLVFQLFR